MTIAPGLVPGACGLSSVDRRERGTTVEYRVTWVVDVDADGPHDAAVKARGMQTRPDTTATVFEVQERRQVRAEWAAPIVEIDLSEGLGALSNGMRQALGVCFGHGPLGGEAVYCDGRCNPQP